MQPRPLLALFLSFLVHAAAAQSDHGQGGNAGNAQPGNAQPGNTQSGNVQSGNGPHACCAEQAECSVIGPGCAPNGMAVPVLSSHLLPEVGSLAQIFVHSPSTRRAFALLAVGFSSEFNSTLGVALPFDLAPLGFPGCSVYTSGDAAIVGLVLHGQGQHEFHFRVPRGEKWCSAPLVFQALVLGPNTTCTNVELLVSNGLRCVVGD